MTVTHGYVPQPAAGVPGLPPGPPSYGWAPPEPPRRGRGMAVALAVVGLLSLTAIGLSIVSLTKSPAAGPSTTTTTSSPSTLPVVSAAATHDLCTTIGPLMVEKDQIANGWINAGPVGTPARDAATPKFVTDMTKSVASIQQILDAHPTADPFLRRSLQRQIDDEHLLAADVGAGPFQPYDQNTWSDSQAAYTGVLTVCSNAGVKW